MNENIEASIYIEINIFFKKRTARREYPDNIFEFLGSNTWYSKIHVLILIVIWMDVHTHIFDLQRDLIK